MLEALGRQTGTEIEAGKETETGMEALATVVLAMCQVCPPAPQ